MEDYLFLFAFGYILKTIGLSKLLRLIFFRIAYPKATLNQIESFEKNTSWFRQIIERKN